MSKYLIILLLSAFGYTNNIAIDYGKNRANKKI